MRHNPDLHSSQAGPIISQEDIDALLTSDLARQARIRFLQRLLAQSGPSSRAAERAELARLLGKNDRA